MASGDYLQREYFDMATAYSIEHKFRWVISKPGSWTVYSGPGGDMTEATPLLRAIIGDDADSVERDLRDAYHEGAALTLASHGARLSVKGLEYDYSLTPYEEEQAGRLLDRIRDVVRRFDVEIIQYALDDEPCGCGYYRTDHGFVRDDDWAAMLTHYPYWTQDCYLLWANGCMRFGEMAVLLTQGRALPVQEIFDEDMADHCYYSENL